VIEIRRYVTRDSKDVLGNWLRDLKDREAKARILVRLDRLAAGNFGDTKPVGDGVHEIRFHFGLGYRCYFARIGDVCVLLLCGGDKGSQQQDIERAIGYWKDYRERQGLT